jgi:hydrogenase-4 component F
MLPPPLQLPMLILVPLLAGLVGFAVRSKNGRAALLVLAAGAHLAIVVDLWRGPLPGPAAEGYLFLDPLGLLFLTIVSVVFAATSIYNVRYRRLTPPRTSRIFLPCNLVLLASMSLMCMSRHLLLIWVASGATTLTAAPLIQLQHGQRALEATWKYLILCSVGVAFALLGIFFVAIAAQPAGGAAVGLFVDDLVALAREGRFAAPWLRSGFIFLLVGFGTKVGLAPMHTWKADTYSEAPTPVAALMATALCNCALLGILRGYEICIAAGEARFAGQLLVALGLVSIGTGAAFVVGQADYKRLLAYSGIEHMGVIALGVGLGGGAVYGAMLHLVGHSLAKGLLFFAAGNVLLAYKTKQIAEVSGVARRMPVTGALLLAGFLATLGFPPFSIFISELTILRGALDARQYVAAGLYLLFLAIIFVAEMALVLKMVQGRDPRGPEARRERESILLTLPALALLLGVAALGLYVPPALEAALARAAQALGG